MSTRGPEIIARLLAGGAAAALLLVGCLPGDTRPTPAVLHFTVEPSPAVPGGVTTSDGWHISFEKLLVGLGGARIEGAACNSYANAGYERLFDFTVPGQQKLSDVYGLGTCEVELRLRTPGSDALLGEGVTAADLDFMRAQETDAVVTLGRRSAYVRGRASRGEVTKRFEWSFRLGFNLDECPGAGDAGLAGEVNLQGGTTLPLALVIHGEELFRERLNDASPLRFDAIADADTDGDQAITLEELASVPGPAPEADAGLVSGDGGAPTLADLLYRGLVPRMVRPGDGEACVVEVREMNR
jgi:hypothetical protein